MEVHKGGDTAHVRLEEIDLRVLKNITKDRKRTKRGNGKGGRGHRADC